MQTFMATSGTKLEPADVDRVVSNLKAYKPDFCIVVSPNGVLPGPTGARGDSLQQVSRLSSSLMM